jgi:hypothetical protein
MTACAHHPAVEATRTCAGCRQAFCPRCVVELFGDARCGLCKNQAVTAMQWEASFRAPSDALVWSLAGLVVLGLAAPVGIVKGREAMKAIDANPRLSGRGRAQAAVALGWVGGALWLVAILLFIVRVAL